MKKPLAVLINDVHLTKDNGSLVKDIFRQAVAVCKKFGINRIFNGGDSFTNRSGQPLSSLTDFLDIIEYLDSEGITMFGIPGNHDKTDADSLNSYLDLYIRDSFRVYRDITKTVISGVNFVFAPYFKDDVWLEQFSKIKIDPSEVNIMITHSGFDGVMNNDGSKVESEIKPSLFKDFDMVYIGHYHDASWLADNVRYAGSAYQNNFGENITDKGFNVIYDDGSYKFIPSKFPKYIKEVLDANDRESLRNLMEKYGEETYDHIRFLFKGKRTDLDKINVQEIGKQQTVPKDGLRGLRG